MSDDLVAGLLTAIEQREKAAQAAADAPPGSRHPGRGRRGLPGAAVIMPSRAWTEYDKLHAPESALRLCRAHRNIVEQYKTAEQRPAHLMADRAHGIKVLEAEAVATALRAVVLSLAVGYGLAEENTDGR